MPLIPVGVPRARAEVTLAVIGRNRPYFDTTLWVDTLSALWTSGYQVSWINLQAYSGGFGNNPQDWIDAVAPVVGSEAAPGFIVQNVTTRSKASGGITVAK